MELSDLDKSIVSTALALAVLSVDSNTEPDNADASTTPNTAAALRSTRTMCMSNISNVFDGRARLRFLVEIVLSMNSSPESLSELASTLESSEQDAMEVCDYICDRIADCAGAESKADLYTAQLHGLGSLYYCLLSGSATNAVFLLIEATLVGMGRLCHGLPPGGSILDYYAVYEHVGALGQMVFDAAVVVLSQRDISGHSDTPRHRERIASALVDTVRQTERLPLVVAVLHSILRVICQP